MLQEANKYPWTAERTRNGNSFPGLLGCSSASEGRSCCLKDKEEAIVCLLSSAKGFAWRAGGCFVSVQRTFVQNFWVGALSPDHIRSHVGRERTAWNLTGVGEGKKRGGGGISPSGSKSTPGLWECGSSCGSQPILVGPESVQNISRVLVLLRVDPFSK